VFKIYCKRVVKSVVRQQIIQAFQIRNRSFAYSPSSKVFISIFEKKKKKKKSIKVVLAVVSLLDVVGFRMSRQAWRGIELERERERKIEGDRV
jgi:hypothetical protein